MKHFRPELYLRSQPRHGRAVVEATVAEWDRAETDYEAELTRDWDRFPAAVRSYLDSVRPHRALLAADGPPDAAYWLYDEFEADPVSDRFTHAILFSDGRELRIPFSSLEV